MTDHGGMSPTPLPSLNDDSQPQSLAAEIRVELANAGLPIVPPDGDLHASGVSIEVGEESVWVSWQIHSALS